MPNEILLINQANCLTILIIFRNQYNNRCGPIAVITESRKRKGASLAARPRLTFAVIASPGCTASV
jgi:hypothetical protein